VASKSPPILALHSDAKCLRADSQPLPFACATSCATFESVVACARCVGMPPSSRAHQATVRARTRGAEDEMVFFFAQFAPEAEPVDPPTVQLHDRATVQARSAPHPQPHKALHTYCTCTDYCTCTPHPSHASSYCIRDDRKFLNKVTVASCTVLVHGTRRVHTDARTQRRIVRPLVLGWLRYCTNE
jgi:hypothetical protein